MGKLTSAIGGAYQQAKNMSMMVAEANRVMKQYPKDKLKVALETDEGIRQLAADVYPKLSESVRSSVSIEKFESVIIATRKGFMKNKKNKRILAQ